MPIVETHLRSINQPKNLEYLSESLSITVLFSRFLGGLILEVRRGITVKEISKDAINEMIIGIPI